MNNYFAVMIDETGCEFGETVSAVSRGAARDMLEEDYPECRIDELLSQDEYEQLRRDRECRAWGEDPYGDDIGW